MKIQAAGSCETLLNLYQTAWQHIPGEIVLHILSFILCSIPLTVSNDMAHFVVQPLFVWVQDVYRRIFVMGLVDWLSCLQPVTVTCCVCVFVREREREREREKGSFSLGNGNVHFHIYLCFSVTWARKVLMCHFSKTVHRVAWVVTWIIVEKKQLFLVRHCSTALMLSWGEC